MKKKKMSFKILENSDKNMSNQLSEHFSLTEAEKDKIFRRSMDIFSNSTNETQSDREEVIQVKQYRKGNCLKYSAAAVFIMAIAVGLALDSKTHNRINNEDKMLTQIVTSLQTTDEARTETTVVSAETDAVKTETTAVSTTTDAAGTETTVSKTETAAKTKETRTETSVYYIAETHERTVQTPTTETMASQRPDIISTTSPVSTKPQEVQTEPKQTLHTEETTQPETPVTTVEETVITDEEKTTDSQPEPVYDENSTAVFSITNTSVKPGESFFIDIVADRNAELSAFQLYLGIDDEVFTVESAFWSQEVEIHKDLPNLLYITSDKKIFQFVSSDGSNIDLNGKTMLRIQLKANSDVAEGSYIIPVLYEESGRIYSSASRYDNEKEKQVNVNIYCNPAVITVTG